MRVLDSDEMDEEAGDEMGSHAAGSMGSSLFSTAYPVGENTMAQQSQQSMDYDSLVDERPRQPGRSVQNWGMPPQEPPVQRTGPVAQRSAPAPPFLSRSKRPSATGQTGPQSLASPPRQLKHPSANPAIDFSGELRTRASTREGERGEGERAQSSTSPSPEQAHWGSGSPPTDSAVQGVTESASTSPHGGSSSGSSPFSSGVGASSGEDENPGSGSGSDSSLSHSGTKRRAPKYGDSEFAEDNYAAVSGTNGASWPENSSMSDAPAPGPPSDRGHDKTGAGADPDLDPNSSREVTPRSGLQTRHTSKMLASDSAGPPVIADGGSIYSDFSEQRRSKYVHDSSGRSTRLHREEQSAEPAPSSPMAQKGGGSLLIADNSDSTRSNGSGLTPSTYSQPGDRRRSDGVDLLAQIVQEKQQGKRHPVDVSFAHSAENLDVDDENSADNSIDRIDTRESGASLAFGQVDRRSNRMQPLPASDRVKVAAQASSQSSSHTGDSAVSPPDQHKASLPYGNQHTPSRPQLEQTSASSPIDLTGRADFNGNRSTQGSTHSSSSRVSQRRPRKSESEKDKSPPNRASRKRTHSIGSLHGTPVMRRAHAPSGSLQSQRSTSPEDVDRLGPIAARTPLPGLDGDTVDSITKMLRSDWGGGSATSNIDTSAGESSYWDKADGECSDSPVIGQELRNVVSAMKGSPLITDESLLIEAELTNSEGGVTPHMMAMDSAESPALPALFKSSNASGGQVEDGNWPNLPTNPASSLSVVAKHPGMLLHEVSSAGTSLQVRPARSQAPVVGDSHPRQELSAASTAISAGAVVRGSDSDASTSDSGAIDRTETNSGTRSQRLGGSRHQASVSVGEDASAGTDMLGSPPDGRRSIGADTTIERDGIMFSASSQSQSQHRQRQHGRERSTKFLDGVPYSLRAVPEREEGGSSSGSKPPNDSMQGARSLSLATSSNEKESSQSTSSSSKPGGTSQSVAISRSLTGTDASLTPVPESRARHLTVQRVDAVADGSQQDAKGSESDGSSSSSTAIHAGSKRLVSAAATRLDRMNASDEASNASEADVQSQLVTQAQRQNAHRPHSNVLGNTAGGIDRDVLAGSDLKHPLWDKEHPTLTSGHAKAKAHAHAQAQAADCEQPGTQSSSSSSTSKPCEKQANSGKATTASSTGSTSKGQTTDSSSWADRGSSVVFGVNKKYLFTADAAAAAGGSGEGGSGAPSGADASSLDPLRGGLAEEDDADLPSVLQRPKNGRIVQVQPVGGGSIIDDSMAQGNGNGKALNDLGRSHNSDHETKQSGPEFKQPKHQPKQQQQQQQQQCCLIS